MSCPLLNAFVLHDVTHGPTASTSMITTRLDVLRRSGLGSTARTARTASQPCTTRPTKLQTDNPAEQHAWLGTPCTSTLADTTQGRDDERTASGTYVYQQ